MLMYTKRNLICILRLINIFFTHFNLLNYQVGWKWKNCPKRPLTKHYLICLSCGLSQAGTQSHRGSTGDLLLQISSGGLTVRGSPTVRPHTVSVQAAKFFMGPTHPVGQMVIIFHSSLTKLHLSLIWYIKIF